MFRSVSGLDAGGKSGPVQATSHRVLQVPPTNHLIPFAGGSQLFPFPSVHRVSAWGRGVRRGRARETARRWLGNCCMVLPPLLLLLVVLLVVGSKKGAVPWAHT